VNLTNGVAKKEKEDIFGKICLKNRLFSNFCSGEAEYGFLKYVVLDRSLRQASEVVWRKLTCSTVFGLLVDWFSFELNITVNVTVIWFAFAVV